EFFAINTVMSRRTSGSLNNVATNAKIDLGVAMLPAGKQRGAPTGGGNFSLFTKTTPAQRDAVVKFVKWMTTPERAAQSGIETGYVAVRPDAWQTPAVKKYVDGIPEAAGECHQLRDAVAERR